MYKVLLVDDERIVKLAIKSMIQWDELGLELAGTASNGNSALQMVEKSNPDIIITDIKMPGMDGVELIKKLRGMEYDGEILVLSNYNDFELVREALRYGAYDYVLKITVNTGDFSKLLKEMLIKLQKKRGAKRESIEKTVDNNAIREYYLKQVLDPEKDDFSAESAELSKLYAISSGDVMYTFAVKAARESTPEPIKLSETIQSIAGEFLAKSDWYSVFETDRNTALFTILYQRGNMVLAPESMADKIADLTRTYYNISLGLVYSDPVSDYKMLFSFARKCIRTAGIFFYTQFEGKVLPMSTNLNDGEQFLEKAAGLMPDKIYEEFLRSTPESAINDLNEIINLAADYYLNPYRLKRTIRKVMREAERKLIYYGYCSEGLFDEYDNEVDIIYTAENQTKLLENIRRMLEKAKQHAAGKKMNYRKEVREAVEYIEKHVSEKIALSDIASRVNLNDTYLCKVFKDDTGKSIVHYINELKMETAYRLLNRGNMMIKEVAASVGIDDPFYFNRLFKKFYGITPKEIKSK